MRKASIPLIVLAGLIALAAVYWHQWRWLLTVGLPLDDSYIHLQYARNLLHGEWFVYNPGDHPTPGDTSPLWVLLLAAGGLFSQNLLAVSLILGGIFYLLTGIVAYRMGERLPGPKWTALAGGLVVMFTGRILWGAASGMEITLFSFCSLLGVWLYLRGKDRGRFSLAAGLAMGLAANARPEGNLLFIFMLLDWVVFKKVMSEKKFRLSDIPWSAGFIYFLLVTPYVLFSLWSAGHPAPNTFYATKLPFNWSRSLEYLWLVLVFFYREHPLLNLMLPVGAGVFLFKGIKGSGKERDDFLIWLWPIGYLLASFFEAPIKYHFQRYLIPVLPFFILISFYGWGWIFQNLPGRLKGKRWSRLGPAWAAVLVIWSGAMSLSYWPGITALCVKNIEEMQVKLGYWIRDNTRPDDLIAANDIGAIFYLSQRPVLDLVGLVNPELLEKVQGLRIPSPARDRITLQYLLEKKPAYLVIFPNWYPRIADDLGDCRRAFSARLSDNIICAGDEMVVYQCLWRKK